MGKAFEKQIKTTEDQGQKQVEALESLKDIENMLININDYEDKLLHWREQEVFKNIYNKRLDKIEELTEKNDDNNLVFTNISTGKTIDFSRKDYTFFNKIF